MTPTGVRHTHRSLIRLALSAANCFSWIFIFQFFYIRAGAFAPALVSLLLTYALSQIIVILLTPNCARLIRHGFKRVLIYASLVLAISFAILAASFAGYLGTIGWGIGLFASLIGVYRALYWVPYAIAHRESPGKTRLLPEILIALAPALAGMLLLQGAPAIVELLGAASFLSLLSIVPLLRLPDVREAYSWGYRQTFHELCAPSRARMVLGSIFGGVEAAALLLLWPLLIFMLLNWSYLMLGIVLSVTFLLALSLRTLFSRPISRMSASTAAVINASAWLLRLSVGGAVGVVLVDTYSNLGARRPRGVDMYAFEQAADNATFVDEETALKEIALALGRLLLCIIGAILVYLVSAPMTFMGLFLVAALAAASGVYLNR